MASSRFLFHASAIGVTGQITRPETHVIPSAASALPPGGGYAANQQEPGQLLEIYSHGGGTTEATGNTNEGGDHETTVTATVQSLNIGNVVLADSITAYLRSVHPADVKKQPRFNTLGSVFKNLQIAGQEITFEPNDDLHNLATLDNWSDYYQKNMDRFLKDAFVDKEKDLHEKQHKYFPYRNLDPAKRDKLPASYGTNVTVVPLFKVSNRSAPGFHVNGNVITVDNFGTIVLGELIIGAYERRLTMLHADLGSPTTGTVSANIVSTNGTSTDP